MFISGPGPVMFLMIIFSVFFIITPSVSISFSLAIFLSLLFLIEIFAFLFPIISLPTILLFLFLLPSVLPILSVLVILVPILTIRILTLFRFPVLSVIWSVSRFRIVIPIIVRVSILLNSVILTPLLLVAFLRIISLIFKLILSVNWYSLSIELLPFFNWWYFDLNSTFFLLHFHSWTGLESNFDLGFFIFPPLFLLSGILTNLKTNFLLLSLWLLGIYENLLIVEWTILLKVGLPSSQTLLSRSNLNFFHSLLTFVPQICAALWLVILNVISKLFRDLVLLSDLVLFLLS